MEELMKVGYKTISKDENGKPASIWYCAVKKGQYGPFISVEKHWVQKVTNEGKILASKYAGKSFNFPIESAKATAMIGAINGLVLKAVKLTQDLPEFNKDTKEQFREEPEWIDGEL